MKFTGAILQETIRHIYCIGLADFKEIFGDSLGDHLWGKLKEDFKNDAGKWICYLDNSNLEALTEASVKHWEKHHGT